MTVQELVERDLKKARINLEQAKERANTPLPEVEHLEELCRLRARIVELTKATDVVEQIFETFRDAMHEKITICEVLFKRQNEGDGDFYEGRIESYRDAINLFAELEKKYTESEDTE